MLIEMDTAYKGNAPSVESDSYIQYYFYTSTNTFTIYITGNNVDVYFKKNSSPTFDK